MSWKDSGGELEAWQRAVDDFAGAAAKPGKLTLWQELMRSQLSARHTEPTSQAVATVGSDQPIALCEMRLSMPMKIDVTIDVPNLQNVDIAAAGVFITWGSTKGVVQVAEVDIGRGWRHPFYASFLRVDFVASRDGIPLNGNQPADMELTASISPASGAPIMPLTCTRFFNIALANGAVDTRTIPSFAKEVRLSAAPGGNYPDVTAEALFSMQNATGVSIFRQQFVDSPLATALNSPSWLFNQKHWPVPQRAAIYRLQNFATEVLANATAIAELQL